MTMPSGVRWGLVMAAGGALWLLLAGPGWVLGWNTDLPGMALLLVSVVCLLQAVSRMPREALMRSASPSEWYARIGLGFTLIAMLYVLANLQDLAGTPTPSPEAAAVARNLVMLLIAWSVISGMLASRWKGGGGTGRTRSRDRGAGRRMGPWRAGRLRDRHRGGPGAHLAGPARMGDAVDDRPHADLRADVGMGLRVRGDAGVLPERQKGGRMNKHETYAWFRVVFIGTAFAWLCWRLFFADATAGNAVWDRTREMASIAAYAFVFALALAWWVESAVCVFHHWRDRR